MKKYLIIIAGALFVASGCSSTVTLGPKANESSVVGLSAGSDGASVTLPLLKGEVSPTKEEK